MERGSLKAFFSATFGLPSFLCFPYMSVGMLMSLRQTVTIQQQHNNSNPENRYHPLRKAHSNRRHGLLCFVFYIIIKRFLSTRARQNIKYHPWKGVKNVSGFQYDVTGTIACAEKVYARSPTGRVKEETVSPVSKFVEKMANQLSQNYLLHKCTMEEHHSLLRI